MQQENPVKTKYNDTELEEFRTLITEKIKAAREELTDLAGTLSASNSNGDDAAIAGKRWKTVPLPWRKSRSTNWPSFDCLVKTFRPLSSPIFKRGYS
ncbi:hypothetical protein [Mucilaginibacter myungsuensis]|uniref:DnaK suppressor protein n=1 Tax=Mucilaginibacter myungsuensis TaxID=649104 RepID=A0A929PWL5_9SPHI|nr:hypothetical protein [Mucilaginibacter myungsuensis]MBE9662958.1 hypothetical protein [Mucilaginibacter myungsuensis]MDN3598586.1 hypothetical protein [Mucilaginibacter myungsuensis]